MLTGLSVRDFVLIEQLDMTPATGLTVLTGETGAGKSILLDALGAACGARSDGGLVRQGAERASVSATFTLPPRHAVWTLLAAQDLPPDPDDTLILRRVIGADGRSKAFLNDTPVSVGLLREVGARLVEVHGQFDTHGLLDPATHRATLDRFGQLDLQPVAAAWQNWQVARTAEETIRHNLHTARQEEDRLRDAVDELTRLSPQTGEEADCLARRQILQEREKIGQALATAQDALTGDQGAETALTTAARALARLADHARIGQALAHLDAARDAVAEAGTALESMQDDMDAAGSTLEQVEDRLYALRAAARRHGVTVDDLPALQDQLSDRLASLDTGAHDLHVLAEATVAAKAAYERAAADLSARRRQVARKLEKVLQAELAPLRMERAHFAVGLTDAPPGPLGQDTVQFQASTNPGVPPGPLNRVASGGELARFMLALKVALAGVGDAVTLVFDEVDQGVGGAVAAAVGDRLAHLGREVQVLVVTHAPQVAAKAAHHWKVSKTTAGRTATRTTTTRTSVAPLSPADRREEIARMLAGETVTDASRKAARALMHTDAAG